MKGGRGGGGTWRTSGAVKDRSVEVMSPCSEADQTEDLSGEK